MGLSCEVPTSTIFILCCRYFSAASQCLSSVCSGFSLSPIPAVVRGFLRYLSQPAAALGSWPGFYYCSYNLLTLLFQRCLKEADVEAFTPTALLPLFSPGNTLFSKSLACVERGFYSLGVGHSSEHPPTPSLCSNACFGNMNNKYVLKFTEDTVQELKSKLEV